MANLSVSVLTPEAALWQGVAAGVTVRTSSGDLTVLAQHTPLVGDVVASVVRVDADGAPVYVAVDGGYLQVESDGDGGTRATILAGVARSADSAEKAREALAELLASA
jgi:F-type H+-transporting ATPase subunit epsilon